jgi:hypothetical protein
MTYLLACNLVVQHIISCNWVLPVGNIFIIIIIIYPSRQFAIPLKVTIALEIFTHNKPYFIHCRKKKLLAFSDLDFTHLSTCLWRTYPIFGYFKSSCHF